MGLKTGIGGQDLGQWWAMGRYRRAHDNGLVMDGMDGLDLG